MLHTLRYIYEVGIYQVWTGERYLIKIDQPTRRLETSLGNDSAEPNSIQSAQTFKDKKYWIVMFTMDWF